MKPFLPLSFHAEAHHSVGSDSRIGRVAMKYSKKSGDKSKSSTIPVTNTINNSYK